MTLKNVTRGLALGAAVAGLSLTATAQNGTNYDALSNGLDVFVGGVGSGGAQTAADGIGHFIPGEDLRGSTRDNIEGDFAYKQYGWRESACILSAGPGGATTLHYASVSWFEFNGSTKTGHSPIVFPNPADTTCVTFPLGGSGGFVGFGAPAGSSANFVIAGLPSAISSASVLLPNENVVPSAAGSSVFILAGAAIGPTPIASTGFCWATQFQWTPSALPSIQDINNGWWHWTQNNPLGNQYWGFSGDEGNLWKSRTVASDGGVTAITALVADAEYNAVSISVQPNTNLATAPAGFFAGGSYYLNTANVVDGVTGGPTLNINGGYDLGGHHTLSLGGTAGVPSINTGLGAQDPAGVGGVAPNGGPLFTSIGFHTYDTTSDAGGKKVVWLSVDFDHLLGIAPSNGTDITVAAGSVRLPAISTLAVPGLQTIAVELLGLFAHEAFACPTCSSGAPNGFAPGSFGVPDTQGASIQLPIPALDSLCNAGPQPGPLVVTYGSSGLKGTAGVGAAASGLTFSQNISATSGHKSFFLFD